MYNIIKSVTFNNRILILYSAKFTCNNHNVKWFAPTLNFMHIDVIVEKYIEDASLVSLTL